jgi:hypothetical protein
MTCAIITLQRPYAIEDHIESSRNNSRRTRVMSALHAMCFPAVRDTISEEKPILSLK